MHSYNMTASYLGADGWIRGPGTRNSASSDQPQLDDSKHLLALKMPRTGHQNTIPVIDISNPSDAVALQVLEAASTHGFLYIKNDGVTIPPKDIDDMFKIVVYYQLI